MKLFPVLLAGSLAVNAALLAALVFIPSDSPPASIGPAIASLATVASGSASVSAATATAPAGTSGSAKPWAALDSGDLGAAVARLRAAGFRPPSCVPLSISASSRAARR